jgi:hypothetical protein
MFIEDYVKKNGIIDRNVEKRYFLKTNKDLYAYLAPFLDVSERSLSQMESLSKLYSKVSGFEYFQSNIEVSTSRIVYQPFPGCSINLENGKHTVIAHQAFIENEAALETRYLSLLKTVSDIIYPKTKNFKELNMLLNQSTTSVVTDKLKKLGINYIPPSQMAKVLTRTVHNFYTFDELIYFVNTVFTGDLKSKIKQQLSLMNFYFKIVDDPNADTPVYIIFNDRISNVKDSNLVFELSYGYRSNACHFHVRVFDDAVKTTVSFTSNSMLRQHENYESLDDIYNQTVERLKYEISDKTNTDVESLTMKDIDLYQIMRY